MAKSEGGRRESRGFLVYDAPGRRDRCFLSARASEPSTLYKVSANTGWANEIFTSVAIEDQREPRCRYGASYRPLVSGCHG